jgi:hypothetical protein
VNGEVARFPFGKEKYDLQMDRGDLDEDLLERLGALVKVPYGCSYDLVNKKWAYGRHEMYAEESRHCDGTVFDCICEAASESRIQADKERWKGRSAKLPNTWYFDQDLKDAVALGKLHQAMPVCEDCYVGCGWNGQDEHGQKSLGYKAKTDCLRACFEDPSCNYAALGGEHKAFEASDRQERDNGIAGGQQFVCRHFLTCTSKISQYILEQEKWRVYGKETAFSASPIIQFEEFSDDNCHGKGKAKKADRTMEGAIPYGKMTNCFQMDYCPSEKNGADPHETMQTLDSLSKYRVLGGCAKPRSTFFKMMCNPAHLSVGAMMIEYSDKNCLFAAIEENARDSQYETFNEDHIDGETLETLRNQKNDPVCFKIDQQAFVSVSGQQMNQKSERSGRFTYPHGKLSFPMCTDKSKNQDKLDELVRTRNAEACAPGMKISSRDPGSKAWIGDYVKITQPFNWELAQNLKDNTGHRFMTYKGRFTRRPIYEMKRSSFGPWKTKPSYIYYSIRFGRWMIGENLVAIDGGDSGDMTGVMTEQHVEKHPNAQSAPPLEVKYAAESPVPARCPNQVETWGEPFESDGDLVVSWVEGLKVHKIMTPIGPTRFRFSSILEDEGEHELDVTEENAIQTVDAVPDVDKFAQESCLRLNGNYNAKQGICETGSLIKLSDHGKKLLNDVRAKQFNGAGKEIKLSLLQAWSPYSNDEGSCDHCMQTSTSADNLKCMLECKGEEAKNKLGEIDSLIQPLQENALAAAERNYRRHSKNCEACYIIRGLITNKELDTSSLDTSTLVSAEAKRKFAKEMLTSSKFFFLEDVAREWEGAKQHWELFQYSKDKLEAQVKWLPLMSGPVLSKASDMLPSIKCILSGHECEEEPLSAEAVTSTATTLKSSMENADPMSGVGATMTLLAQLKTSNSETRMQVMRDVSEATLQTHVKQPLLNRVEDLMAMSWSFVDHFVNTGIGAIASAVGVFPFVGGILSATVTMVLNYVYTTIKTAINKLVMAWVEELSSYIIQSLLNNLLPVEGQEEATLDLKSGIQEAKHELDKIDPVKRSQEFGLIKEGERINGATLMKNAEEKLKRMKPEDILSKASEITGEHLTGDAKKAFNITKEGVDTAKRVQHIASLDPEQRNSEMVKLVKNEAPESLSDKAMVVVDTTHKAIGTTQKAISVADAVKKATTATFQRIGWGTCSAAGFVVIVDAAKCETAAVQLGLADTSAHTKYDTSDRPYGCIYGSNDYLQLNAQSNSVPCGGTHVQRDHDEGYDCICEQEPKAAATDKELVGDAFTKAESRITEEVVKRLPEYGELEATLHELAQGAAENFDAHNSLKAIARVPGKAVSDFMFVQADVVEVAQHEAVRAERQTKLLREQDVRLSRKVKSVYKEVMVGNADSGI